LRDGRKDPSNEGGLPSEAVGRFERAPRGKSQGLSSGAGHAPGPSGRPEEEAGIDDTGRTGERPPLRLRLHATPQAAVDLRESLRTWLEDANATEQETFDVTLACSEAFANSVGNPLRPATLIIEVEATVNAHRLLTLIVRDYALARPERSPEETSMFLRLMETLVESAETHARPDGSTIVLRRHLRSTTGGVGVSARGRGGRSAGPSAFAF
jgi:anti-sigma regulatory factor (Ser/Thr protein kinase)